MPKFEDSEKAHETVQRYKKAKQVKKEIGSKKAEMASLTEVEEGAWGIKETYSKNPERTEQLEGEIRDLEKNRDKPTFKQRKEAVKILKEELREEQRSYKKSAKEGRLNEAYQNIDIDSSSPDYRRDSGMVAQEERMSSLKKEISTIKPSLKSEVMHLGSQLKEKLKEKIHGLSTSKPKQPKVDKGHER